MKGVYLWLRDPGRLIVELMLLIDSSDAVPWLLFSNRLDCVGTSDWIGVGSVGLWFSCRIWGCLRRFWILFGMIVCRLLGLVFWCRWFRWIREDWCCVGLVLCAILVVELLQVRCKGYVAGIFGFLRFLGSMNYSPLNLCLQAPIYSNRIWSLFQSVETCAEEEDQQRLLQIGVCKRAWQPVSFLDLDCFWTQYLKIK